VIERAATAAVTAAGTVTPEAAVGPLVLTLDIGTSSLRTELYDRHGRAVAGPGARKTYEVVTTADGGVELDPDEIVKAAVTAIDEIVQQAGPLAGRIGAVATDTFWHNMIALDGDGRPLSPIYTWADTRATTAAEQLKQELNERAVHQRTGCVLHASYWPAKLRWLAVSRPDLVQRTQRWASIGEYLYFRLTGKWNCSVSMASGTGLLDQHRRTWDAEVLAALHLRSEQLSPLTSGSEPLGGLLPDYASRWPGLRQAVWYPAAGDGACSNVGSGCTDQSRFALMIGTSGAMRVCFAADDVAVRWGLWCYHATPAYFVLGGALSNGGILWEWLQRTLRLPEGEAAEQAMAAMEPDAHGLTVLPFLAGERSPNWAGHARAAFVGISLNTQPIDMMRAGLESVCYRFALIYELLQTIVPGKPQLVANGGAVLHSPLWMQMLADVLGSPLTASGEQEATSRGAALLALLSLGAIPSLTDASAPAALGRTYEPDAAHHERYHAAALRQRRLYELLIVGGQGLGA
jgi:gluconokinase